ncbi:hypothetical protein [Kordiimonas lacus]|uniref:Uncharacterized protein n=1 Tax=Kordiimonas lacus TaxID=637679 RepID=A0A1G7DHD2_9PROT|nr:hypothetical protein [Kordiimonas lacus]SDE50859.1 hypothetical protein SAMN04488071_3113 [Kordiimonas lacus]
MDDRKLSKLVYRVIGTIILGSVVLYLVDEDGKIVRFIGEVLLGLIRAV